MEIDGVHLPRFLYGTAWKEQDTARLTGLALAQGFRGIDTANQRRHYHEAGVGEALSAAFAGGLEREAVFLQTKFTFRRGQDDRLPYAEDASVADQVAQSLASSLDHLGVEAVDSYVLHGPTLRAGLTEQDVEAWRAMERLHDRGATALLGVSNVSGEQLEALHGLARVKPRFVQNRCYAVRGWDREVRQFCARNGIVYQGFSLLTANRDALAHPELGRIAAAHGREATQIVFRFALDVGMLPLTGTSDPAHMRADLAVREFTLTADEVATIERLMVRG